MRLINRNTNYAVRALSYMARQENKVTPVSELARRLKAPRPFLRKILQALNKNGFLTSYKGQGGGFKLGRKANEIFLADLLRTLQGQIRFSGCILRRRCCPDIKKCRLKKRVDEMERYVVAQLQSITIASICDNTCKIGS